MSQKNTLNRALQLRNEEILQQQKEVLEQQEKLVAINQVKDRILSVIGHDLRNPFTSVVQAMELIRSGVLEAADKEFIFENFHRQVVSLSELINNLLVWAVSLQTGAPTQKDKIDLTRTTEKVFSLYKATAQQKKQQLIHQYQQPVLISADGTHIQIILQNIISNAIKFTPNKGKIEVRYSFEPGYTIIHIHDTGRGMPEKKLQRLFNTSGRVISENGTNEEMGTGLGLLLVKQFAEENGAHIAVKSEPGKGSEFIVYFKSFPEPESDPLPPPAHPATT